MTETEEEYATTQSVGDRLREARESQGLSLEDVAERTRIPLRHLESIEAAEWDRLPAPTYTIGFAKSYATAIGLDRNEIGEQIRDEIGSPRPVTTAESFEPVDPARTMPRWLILGAIAGIILVVLVLTWLNSRSLQPDPEPAAAEETAAAEPAQSGPSAVSAAPAPAASGPVLLTAEQPVWIQVYERGGRTLFQGELGAGQHYQVPASASDPLLRTGKPEALKVTVGQAPAPPIGPPARTVSDVSLKGEALMGQAAPPAEQ